MAIQVKQRFKLDKDAIIYLISQMIKGDKEVTDMFTEALEEIKPVINEAEKNVQEALSKVTEVDERTLAWCIENDETKIDGAKIYTDKAFANAIFSHDIIASGTITGVTIYGSHVEATSGTIGPFKITSSGLVSNATTTGLHIPYYANDPNGNTYQGYIDIGKYDTQSSWNSPIYIYRNGYGSSRLDADGLIVKGESMYSNECYISSGLTVGYGAYISGNLTLTGNINLDNSQYLHGYYNGYKRIAAMGSTGNIYFGVNNGAGGMYCYVSYQKNFRVLASSDENECFSSIMYNNSRYFKSDPIYARKSGSGTGYTVKVDSKGYVFRDSSSMRYKENITTKLNPELDPERLYDLNIWQYNYREGHFSEDNPLASVTYIGFLAEDVKQHYPIAALINDEGYAESWDERTIIPPMLKLIQDHHAEIEELKEQVRLLTEGGIS